MRLATRKARRRRRPGTAAPLGGDVLALAVLGAVLCGLLLYTASQPPTRREVRVANLPADVVLVNFFGPERNATGAYRWSKPEATAFIPVVAPAVYRVTLYLQDNPAAPPRRPVTVAIDGVDEGTFVLSDSLQPYSVAHPVDPRVWSADRRHALRVDLRTAPFHPSGDDRTVGVIVARMTVEPVRRLSAWQPALFIPNLLLLAALYGVLRLLGAGTVLTAGTLGVLLAGYAALTAVSRAATLRLMYEAVAQPGLFVATLLFLAAVPVLAATPTGWADAWGRARAALWGRRRLALPAGLGEALWLFVALRLLYSLFALLASLLFRLPGPCSRGVAAPSLHANGLDFRLLGVWQWFDGCQYERIAAQGYPPGGTAVAFFPLYPALMRAVGPLFAGNLTVSGLVISGVAYVAAVAGLYRLVCLDFDSGVARRTVLYLSVFPTAFILFAPYTEALFLALAVWLLYCARQERWAMAAPLALLVGFSRPQGCLLAVPLAWECWRQWRAGRHRVAPAFVALAPFVGLAAFTLFGRAVVGLTPFRAQASWKTTYHAPWTVIALAWQARADTIIALNLVALLLFGVLLAMGLRRLPLVYSLYALPQFLLLATRINGSSLVSTWRYVLVLIPAFILLGQFGRHRALHLCWLIASLLLLALLFYTTLSGRFAA